MHHAKLVFTSYKDIQLTITGKSQEDNIKLENFLKIKRSKVAFSPTYFLRAKIDTKYTKSTKNWQLDEKNETRQCNTKMPQERIPT